MKFVLLTAMLFAFAMPAFAQSIPAHATPNQFGYGWSCDKGYSRTGHGCSKVVVPKNARLNFLGHGWECDHGYQRTGDRCTRVPVPQHASINYLGHGWECDHGYFRSGSLCKRVIVPSNAKLNYLGHGWKCDKGFKRSGQSCRRMTAHEIQRQQTLMKAVRAEMKRRRTMGVSGDDCETEYKTNASVCVSVTNGNLDCDKSYSGDHYDSCMVDLSYEVRTDYRGGASLDVDVECTVEIDYNGQDMYVSRSDSDSQDNSTSLSAYGSDSEDMEFDFSFSSYDKVTQAKISSASCEIGNVDLF